MNPTVLAWLALLLTLTTSPPPAAARGGGPSVGMPATLNQLVLPGGELEVKPFEGREPAVVLRIAAVYPHGDAFRYDLNYTGFVAGTHDLRQFLKRKDGSSTADLPPIPVVITSLLPPGQIQPHGLEIERGPRLGGYRWFLMIAGALWLFILAAILMAGRPVHSPRSATNVAPLTLADHLRPLIEDAVAGVLKPQRLAELERLLIGYWLKRLNLEDCPPADLMKTLRQHDQAGPLLHQLETWLHRPGGSDAAIDVPALLSPYRDLPPEQLGDLPEASTRSAPSPSGGPAQPGHVA